MNTLALKETPVPRALMNLSLGEGRFWVETVE